MSDICLVSSGVGLQSRCLMEGLLRTGKFCFRQIGGAVKHPSYNPIQVEPWGTELIVIPRDSFGDKLFLRSLLDAEKPDALMLFTDPRFFVWIWEMSDEILPRMPILYWHVWDNLPVPTFNNNFYRSTTYTGCISKLTHGILKSLGHGDRSSYIPHAVQEDIFKPLAEAEVQAHKVNVLGEKNKDKFVVFWNNRNARRKNSSDMLSVIKELSSRVEKNKVLLLMHTNPFDPEGVHLPENIEMMKVNDLVVLSQNKLDLEKMNVLYNIADVTCNIAYAEGFGLSSLESIMAGTCVVSNRTGGLQDQIDESVAEKDKWGWLIGPDNTTLVGSQQIFFIAEDRVNVSTVVDALEEIYNLTREERKRRGLIAREWALENFNMKDMIQNWDKAICDVIENYKTKYHHFDEWRFHTL